MFPLHKVWSHSLAAFFMPLRVRTSVSLPHGSGPQSRRGHEHDENRHIPAISHLLASHIPQLKVSRYSETQQDKSPRYVRSTAPKNLMLLRPRTHTQHHPKRKRTRNDQTHDLSQRLSRYRGTVLISICPVSSASGSTSLGPVIKRNQRHTKQREHEQDQNHHLEEVDAGDGEQVKWCVLAIGKSLVASVGKDVLGVFS